nr:unnamed protein product [Digitaria exilis]
MVRAMTAITAPLLAAMTPPRALLCRLRLARTSPPPRRPPPTREAPPGAQPSNSSLFGVGRVPLCSPASGFVSETIPDCIVALSLLRLSWFVDERSLTDAFSSFSTATEDGALLDDMPCRPRAIPSTQPRELFNEMPVRDVPGCLPALRRSTAMQCVGRPTNQLAYLPP